MKQLSASQEFTDKRIASAIASAQHKVAVVIVRFLRGNQYLKTAISLYLQSVAVQRTGIYPAPRHKLFKASRVTRVATG